MSTYSLAQIALDAWQTSNTKLAAMRMLVEDAKQDPSVMPSILALLDACTSDLQSATQGLHRILIAVVGDLDMGIAVAAPTLPIRTAEAAQAQGEPHAPRD